MAQEALMSSSATQTPPLLTDFLEALRSSFFSFLAKPIDELIAQEGQAYVIGAEKHLERIKTAFPDKPWPKAAVESYTRFNKEILREELEFKKTGRYAMDEATLAEVCEKVYDNPEVMEAYYLEGLYLTYYFWPHHYDLVQYYTSSFVHRFPGGTTLTEWGVGHGFLSLLFLEKWKGMKVRAYDISRHSIAYSEQMFRSAGIADVSFHLADILENECPQTDALICGELLEHVPDPNLLLQRAAATLAPEGRMFMTAAINAAQEDHVTLFRSDSEVLDLMRAEGFEVESSLTITHPNRVNEEAPPQVVACVLKHARPQNTH
ncbi:MAG: methyltransferase domain-containing protein [Bdellovibrionales bacterium]|nr:methyltransferase domain-containing protein [Bdellovibrionales bacterium]